jgi:dTMP kinase
VTQRAELFVTLEGGEGVGKSTAAARLADLLRAEGAEVVLTREPGGTAGAEAIRALLLGGIALDPLAQTMLHFSARADHVAAVIRPALAAGKIVICDRFYDSTMAYQGFGQGVDVAAVASLIRLINLKPDVTFMLEAPDSVIETRLRARGGAADRYEALGMEFFARVAHGFRTIAASEPGRCAVIDAAGAPEAVASALRATLRARTGR